MSKFLQQGQVEAHVSRLNAIRTQCLNYADDDVRAAEAIPALEAVIAIFGQEAAEPNTAVAPVEDAAGVVDPDDLPFE